MATMGRTLSPGGALLRASRLFSLPSAIPPPTDLSTANSYRSDTATQTFPTLQTVTAPDNFRHRGDWGFKRNFPLKSTAKTSTPYLRIKQVDSIEHVTDFSSASDHTLSLEKLEAMNMVITLPVANTTTSDYKSFRGDDPIQSVFDDRHDFTHLEESKINEAGMRRWKYKGPWLANLSNGAFQTYIKRQVRGRRVEFREFLKVRMCPGLSQKARQRAMDEGSVDANKIHDVRPEDVTDEQVMEFLRRSREHRDELYSIVSEFLDLAPCEENGVKNFVDDLTAGQTKEFTADDPYSKLGTPITHPSAGLSYLRTDSYLDNHPVYGPQQSHRPVKVRVMTMQGANPFAGVGGFVAPFEAARKSYANPDVSRHDEHNMPGGPKLWASVQSAHVNSVGQVILHLGQVDADARMIEEERQGEGRVFHSGSLQDADAAKEIRSTKWNETPPTRRSFRKEEYKTSDATSYGLPPSTVDTSAESLDF